MAGVELPIRRAMGDARASFRDVDEVILIGGATAMPMIRERVAAIFGKAPRCELNACYVIALGGRRKVRWRSIGSYCG